MARRALPAFRNDPVQFPGRGVFVRPRPPVLVIGAGPTGLSAAYHLGAHAELIDRNPTVGGRCRSLVEDGFTFDFADNVLFGENLAVRALSVRLLAENLHWQERRASLFLDGAAIPVPFAKGLRGLPKDALQAFQRKLWKVPLEHLDESADEPEAGASRFGYPLEGGFQAVMDGFLPLLARRPRMQTALTGLALDDQVASLSDGTRYDYEALVSTLPLPAMVRLAGAQAPERVRRAAEGLRHVALRRVHVGVGRDDLTDRHVIEFPGEAIFHRVIAQGNASPTCQPAGTFGLTFEITHHAGAPLPADGLPLVRRCIEDAQRFGLIRRDDPIRVATQTDLPNAFVIPESGHAQRVEEIRRWFARYAIHLPAANGEWTSADCEHAMLAGRDLAEQVSRSPRPTVFEHENVHESVAAVAGARTA